MSKIKIFGLGGLNEDGKNIYIVEVDNDIFVLDCGLKFATENMYGVDYIIPDFEYLVQNKKRIRGVFITHGHYENMGAVNELLTLIPQLKVYATTFTKYMLINDGVSEKNIVEITPHKKIGFKSCSVFPMSISHSAPDSVMYVINTKDGAICYTGDFVIDPLMMGHYSMDIGKYGYIGKQGVLCLLSESINSEKNGHTAQSQRLTEYYRDIVNKAPGRIFFSVLPNNIYTIGQIFNSIENTDRKVVAMGKNLQNIINFAKKENYLSFSDEILGDLNNIKDNNTVFLIGDDKEKPYNSVDKIINGYDKYLSFRKDDTVIFAEPRWDSSEKKLVHIEDEIARMDAKSISLPKDKTVSLHASKEDLMLMIKLLSPKYYMPVKGEYRYMVENGDIANSLGVSKDNIILKQNGDVVEFNNGELVNKFEKIKVNDILIDGKSNDDIGELVLKDREMLSENGILLISATLNKRTKQLLAGPEVTTRGFIYVKDSGDMISEIKEISKTIIDRNTFDNYVEYTKIKTEIREELSKYFYEKTECKPMIIAVIQEI